MSLDTELKTYGRIGLGGEGVLRTAGRSDEAREVIYEALEQGIGYFDSARVYADSERYYGSVWREQSEARGRIFQTSKSASRRRDEALADLESTLKRLETDYLDLWQIHDVRDRDDLDAISGPGGALEAFVEARKSGKVRFIGVTGHQDPAILTQAVESWPVDAVLLPVNPVEAVLGGFLTATLPAARAKNIAVIAMKILGGSHYLNPALPVSAQDLIRFALSFDVTMAIVGCSSREEVKILGGVKNDGAVPADAEKVAQIEKTYEPYARKLAFYRGRDTLGAGPR